MVGYCWGASMSSKGTESRKLLAGSNSWEPVDCLWDCEGGDRELWEGVEVLVVSGVTGREAGAVEDCVVETGGY